MTATASIFGMQRTRPAGESPAGRPADGADAAKADAIRRRLQDIADESAPDGPIARHGPPPNVAALDNARWMLEGLLSVGIVPLQMAPSAVGGVGFTLIRGGQRAYVECANSGSTLVLFFDHDDDPTIFRVERDDVSLAAGVRRVEGYLNGSA